MTALLMSLTLPLAAAAQSGAVYVNHEKVTAALAKGAVLLTAPNVTVAGARRDKAGPIETEKGTTILYVTDGQATLVADGQTKSIAQGDVVEGYESQFGRRAPLAYHDIGAFVAPLRDRLVQQVGQPELRHLMRSPGMQPLRQREDV